MSCWAETVSMIPSKLFATACTVNVQAHRQVPCQETDLDIPLSASGYLCLLNRHQEPTSDGCLREMFQQETVLGGAPTSVPRP